MTLTTTTITFIRVGYFENFKGADTLLIDIDHEGLDALIAWLQEATSSGQEATINNCPGTVVQPGAARPVAPCSSDSVGRPDRGEDEIGDWAREHDLPYFDGQVHFRDYRIEYEVEGREHHEDVELFTPHYRGAHAVSRGKTGFRIYVVGSRGSGGRSQPHPRIMEDFL